MTIYYSDVQNVVNPPSYGQPLPLKVKASKLGGRLRLLESFFVVPAATLAIADKIVWGKLPQKAKLLGHLSKLTFTAGTASSTVNLGDNIVPARYLAATAVNAAGSAVPIVAEQASTCTGTTAVGSNVVQVTAGLGAIQLGALITGTGIAAGTTITGFSLAGPNNMTVTLSANATASGTVTLTCTGGQYETTEDSNSLANGFGSATDDCTLISTVAGAVLAANQVLTLKAVWIQD